MAFVLCSEALCVYFAQVTGAENLSLLYYVMNDRQWNGD